MTHAETENVFLPRAAEIVRAVQITEKEKHFTLKMRDGIDMQYEPGQIVELGLMGYGEIPIGFASSPTRKKTFDVVIRSVGRVSNAINKKNKGEDLFVRGPLGHGFDTKAMKGHPILIVAGGIGLCPTRSMIQYVLDCRKEFGDFKLFFGAKSPSEQLFLEDLEKWRHADDVEYYETVDKADANWKGNVGVITTLFKKTKVDPDTRVIICGPPIMYKFVIRELDAIGIPHNHIFVDLERRMKCGIGKCGHCQMNDKYVCLHGPVFSFDQIEKLEEAF